MGLSTGVSPVALPAAEPCMGSLLETTGCLSENIKPASIVPCSPLPPIHVYNKSQWSGLFRSLIVLITRSSKWTDFWITTVTDWISSFQQWSPFSFPACFVTAVCVWYRHTTHPLVQFHCLKSVMCHFAINNSLSLSLLLGGKCCIRSSGSGDTSRESGVWRHQFMLLWGFRQSRRCVLRQIRVLVKNIWIGQTTVEISLKKAKMF